MRFSLILFEKDSQVLMFCCIGFAIATAVLCVLLGGGDVSAASWWQVAAVSLLRVRMCECVVFEIMWF